MKELLAGLGLFIIFEALWMVSKSYGWAEGFLWMISGFASGSLALGFYGWKRKRSGRVVLDAFVLTIRGPSCFKKISLEEEQRLSGIERSVWQAVKSMHFKGECQALEEEGELRKDLKGAPVVEARKTRL